MRSLDQSLGHDRFLAKRLSLLLDSYLATLLFFRVQTESTSELWQAVVALLNGGLGDILADILASAPSLTSRYQPVRGGLGR